MKKISRIKQFAILQKEKIRQQFSKAINDFQLPLQLEANSKVLVCLPENSSNLNSIIRDITTFLPSQTLVFCGKDSLDEPFNISFFSYGDLPITLLRTLRNLETSTPANALFDLAIDLNPEFVLTPALLCKASGAPVRISGDKENAALFFNLIIRNFSNGNEKNGYPTAFFKQLQTLIQSFNG